MSENKNMTNRLRGLVLEKWHPYFWVAVIAFFLYFKTAAFRYTYLDDSVIILDNFWFLSKITNIFKCFFNDIFLMGHDPYYRPILMLSFILNAQVGGASPFVYHITNVLIHCCCSVLVCVLLVKLSYGRKKAFLLSALFAVHPALSQAVAWIPGRNDSLLAVFVISAFIFLIKYFETFKPRDLCLHIIFINLAFYTKETAFILIPVSILYLLLILKPVRAIMCFEKIDDSYELSSNGMGSSRQLNLPDLSNKVIDRLTLRRISFFVCAWSGSLLLWLAMRHLSGTKTPELTLFAFKNIFKEFLPSLVLYLGKVVFPFNLSGAPFVKDSTLVYGFIVLALIAAALFFTKRGRVKYSLFGIAWFILFLSPTFMFSMNIQFEHRLYLPVIGFLILVAEVQWQKICADKRWLTAASVLVIIVFSSIAFAHSDIFISRLIFWESAVKTSPDSSYVHDGLGRLYIDFNKYELSEKHLKKAIELDPVYYKSHDDLGILLMEKGDLKEAEKEFKIADRLNPCYWSIYKNYGFLCYEQKHYKDAVRLWEQSIQFNPNAADVYKTMAWYYAMNGDVNKRDYYKGRLKDRFGISIYFSTETMKR